MIEELQFAWPQLVWLLFAPVLVLFACGFGNARRRRILGVFGLDLTRAASWLRACGIRRWSRALLLGGSLALAGVAATQPRSNPERSEFKVKARDLAVVFDVSRSMLAEDLKPNRLERMKLEVSRLADHLKGDRVGLIAFAGSAETLCPLTSNYSYFKSVVRTLDERSAARGGTEIGDAIRRALRLLGFSDHAATQPEGEGAGETVLEEEAKKSEESFADILLITDGENHGLDPKYAVASAAAHGVGLYIIGIGSKEGVPIPIRGTNGGVDYVRYKGEIVKTQLDEVELMELVQAAPRGAYLPVGTANPDLVDFYDKRIAPATGRELVEEHITWTEIFQPFLLAGLALYLAYLAVPERPGRVRSVHLVEAQGA